MSATPGFGGIGAGIGQAGVTAGVFGPWGPLVGLGIGSILDIVGSNQAARDNVSKRNKQTRKQTKYLKDVHEWQNEEAQRQADWQQSELDIKIANFNEDRKYQVKAANQRRDYQMGIRQFQFDQQTRAYEKSLEIYGKQRSFNELAETQALNQQDRYYHDTLTGMEFDDQQTILNYAAATAGFGLKKSQARITADIQLQGLRDKSYLGMEAAKAKTAFGKQQTSVEALKAAGQASVRGQAGVSAGKLQQGVAAEAGARKAQLNKELVFQQRDIMVNMMQNQRNIVAQLLFAEADADLNLMKLDDQLELDRAKIYASKSNLKANDRLVRERIARQRAQADMNAEARVMLEPELGPEIPPVLDLPEYQFGTIYRPEESPQPKQNTGYIPTSPFAGASTVLSNLTNFVQSSAGQDIFTNLFGGNNTGGIDFTSIAGTNYDFSTLGNIDFNPNIGIDFGTSMPNVDLTSFPSFSGGSGNVEFGSVQF